MCSAIVLCKLGKSVTLGSIAPPWDRKLNILTVRAQPEQIKKNPAWCSSCSTIICKCLQMEVKAAQSTTPKAIYGGVLHPRKIADDYNILRWNIRRPERVAARGARLLLCYFSPVLTLTRPQIQPPHHWQEHKVRVLLLTANPWKTAGSDRALGKVLNMFLETIPLNICQSLPSTHKSHPQPA